MSRSSKVVFLVNDDVTFLVQRLVMAAGIRDAGYDVHVAAQDTGASSKIQQLGFTFHPLDLHRGGINPIADLLPFIRLVKFLNRERPDFLHCVSIKPVLYGAIAGSILGIKNIICLVNGLGYAFSGNGFKGRIIKLIASSLYRFAFSYKGVRAIFQNPEDQAYFVDNRLIAGPKTYLIRGSGVDVEKFKQVPFPGNEIPTVLFAGRLLWSKGIRELVQAVKKLKAHESFKLIIVGEPDDKNPECVPRSYLEELQAAGIITWLGRQSDMPRLFQNADIICLPTLYKEGLPLTLLEAASCGRPLVATNVPGCREIVRHGENGFLVEPHNVDDLAEALRKLIQSRELREGFGAASARIVREEFSAQFVQQQLLRVYQSLGNERLVKIK